MPMRKEVGVVGLGKMGGNIATHLLVEGYTVVGYDLQESNIRNADRETFSGYKPAFTPEELVKQLQPRRVIWMAVPSSPSGDAVDSVLESLLPFLYKGDILIDAGNSRYKKTQERHARLQNQGINFLDAGCSGGPFGASTGMAIMIGGDEEPFNYAEQLFSDLSRRNGYCYFGPSGAGHYAKMIHNGIEYGMMQALAEGFGVLKKSDFKFNLVKLARVYSNGSVIESHLVEWLQEAYAEFGENLDSIDGRVSHTGEGQWTVETAKEMGMKLPAIEAALQFRIDSQENPSYEGKILSAMRHKFGGHSVKEK